MNFFFLMEEALIYSFLVFVIFIYLPFPFFFSFKFLFGVFPPGSCI